MAAHGVWLAEAGTVPPWVPPASAPLHPKEGAEGTAGVSGAAECGALLAR